ncbi:MAG: dTDP-4-dehydrorhamnose reductase [Methanosarcinaceae archaeon]|nr:dTDP-4-dehydrorhamnose reductase [Methanosarcinaceae archaeon]
MKVVVTGNKGMLGRDLVERLWDAGFDLIGVDVGELDITRLDNVLDCLRSFDPDLVINCAAYTAVDKAESESELAFSVNKNGPANLSSACKKIKIPFIHISTDYVFNGIAKRPYREDDPVSPLGAYGRSKWEGEEAVRSLLEQHIIMRTSWLYGVYGNNFVKTILRLSNEKEEIRVVADQKGCPTWTGDLSDALVTLVQRIDKGSNEVSWGTYHFCGAGNTSWYELALAIVKEASRRSSLKVLRVLPIPTPDYPTPAKRPMWSVMDCSKIQDTFDIKPKKWEKSLTIMLDKLYDNTDSESNGN